MKPGNRLYPILHNKCPRCHRGDFFVGRAAYNLGGFLKMYDRCPVCGLSYEPEPGYYFGAMYMSYIINVGIMLAVWGASMVLFDDLNVWWLVAATIVVGLAFTPLTFRLARRMWIGMFVKFDPSIGTGNS